MGKVVVLGSVNTDYVAVSPRLPKAGETVVGGHFFKAGGGKGANQAVAAARLGAACSFIGAVGNDADGDAAIQDLRTEGVEVRFIFRKPQHSGVAVIFVAEKSGENEIVVAAGANAALSPPDVLRARDALGDASVLLAQLEVPLESVQEGLRLARQSGLITLLNPAPATARKALEPLLPFVDYISPNRHELKALSSGRTLKQAARGLLKKGFKGVFVTLGAGGALFVADEQYLKVPAFKVKVVDTVGAGDAFNGALAVGLAEGMPPEELLRFASAAGALAVTKPGARPSQPYRRQVERLISGG